MAIVVKLLRKVKKLFHYIYLTFKYSLGHSPKKQDSSKILIYFYSGRLGDLLIDACAVKCLTEYYQHAGKQVYFLCSGATKVALELFMSLEDITFVPVKMKDTDAMDIDSVEQFLKREYFDKVIHFGVWESLWTVYLIACTNCNESWEVVSKRKNIRRDLTVFFLKWLRRDFTNRVIVDRETPQTERTKRLLYELGIRDFKTSIMHIPKTCDFVAPTKPYITISIDSNDTKRRWEANKFIQLIRLLLDHGREDIYLTGVHVDSIDLEKYMSAFQGEDRVKIKIDQLQLREWIELIRGSSLLIGVDSGAIHVAASVGTKSVCLTGVWDGKRVMPYQRDVRTAGTKEPACVMRSDVNPKALPCYGCLGIKNIGYRNALCYAECRNLRPCLCMQAIEVDDVWKTVRNMT